MTLKEFTKKWGGAIEDSYWKDLYKARCEFEGDAMELFMHAFRKGQDAEREVHPGDGTRGE